MNDLTLYGNLDEVKALQEILQMDDGEITEEYEILAKKVELELVTKVDRCVGYIDSLKDKIELAKNKKKDLDAFIKFQDTQINKFTDYVKYCMENFGHKEFKGTMSVIKLRKPSKAVEIYDEKLIPSEFIEVVQDTKILKSEIAKSLKAGQEVSGAKLVDGKTSLQIGIAK